MPGLCGPVNQTQNTLHARQVYYQLSHISTLHAVFFSWWAQIWHLKSHGSSLSSGNIDKHLTETKI